MSFARHVSPALPRVLRTVLCAAMLGSASFVAHAESRTLLMEAMQAEDSDCSMEYPEEAMKKHQQGTVRVKFWVDAAGKASKIEVLQSSSYPVLDNAAMAAAACAKFMPRVVDGRPVPSWMAQSTKYDLTRRPAGRSR